MCFDLHVGTCKYSLSNVLKVRLFCSGDFFSKYVEVIEWDDIFVSLHHSAVSLLNDKSYTGIIAKKGRMKLKQNIL